MRAAVLLVIVASCLALAVALSAPKGCTGGGKGTGVPVVCP